MTVALTSRIFCSASHMGAVFLRCCDKLKEFQLYTSATYQELLKLQLLFSGITGQ